MCVKLGILSIMHVYTGLQESCLFIAAYTRWLNKKCPTGQNAISRQPTEIFLPNFQDLRAKDFSTVLLNFHRNIFIASKIAAFTIFCSIFQHCAEEMDIHL